MGVLPDLLPGYRPVDLSMGREEFERRWGERLSPDRGLTLVEMIQGAISGHITSMYVIGENPVITDPDRSKTIEALKRLDFFVCQDIFLSDTARFADVVLPGASFTEKDGTFTNTERRVQRLKKAIDPPGDARTDMEILLMLGKSMGYEKQFSYKDAQDVFDEIRDLVPEYRGITYERLKSGGIQWPCPHEGHPGTPSLFSDGFEKRKGRFFQVDFRPGDRMPDEEFPFCLIVGRSLYHYHSGTMSRRIEGNNEVAGEPFIEMHPDDAKRMGISDGDWVKIYSETGHITGKVSISNRLNPRILFTTFHFPDMPVNLVTGSRLDPISKIPSLKMVPVKISRY